MGDHPRSRGVYPSTPSRRSLVGGSSPLARGLLGHALGVEPADGIIPARAGFTHSACGPQRTRRDHPRSRGVYGLTGCLCRAAWGSSPLARGLPATARHQVAPRGIIPARAGFTAPSPWSTARAEDHPRSRGVYGRTPLYPGPGRGSSPLARGLPVSLRRPLNTAGIIPARAGFTPKHIAGRAPHMDHPRSRGVYNISDDDPAGEGGSSPLARGLRPARVRAWLAIGIIPARAGFTPRVRVGGRRRGDHPRSRGVYAAGDRLVHGGRGSSPLARGLPPTPTLSCPGRRIIPARAGFTW